MNWGRVNSVLIKHGHRSGAKRVWAQQFGADNGFGLAADWGGGRKKSVMVSRQLPDSIPDEQLDELVSAAIDNLRAAA